MVFFSLEGFSVSNNAFFFFVINPLLEGFAVSNNAFFSFEILSLVTVLVWNKALFSFEMLSLVSSPAARSGFR